MTIEQKTFFGASIRGFNISLGWGSQISTLNVDLVEDPVNGDSFNPNPIGYPAYFTYYGFTFGGLVQKYSRSGSFQGNPLHSVVLTDPREILDGVQVVLDGYTGSTSAIPNLYNVYGTLENASFGSSQVNEAGMPWFLLGNTLIGLIDGNPINFRGQPFYLNLDNLPQLPEEYRIGGGTNISVMEYISSVCDAGACDFFFTLEPGNIITVYTVSRAVQPQFGLINQFISNTEGAVGHEIGLELRNETTSKFLVGGQVATMYIQNKSEEGTEEDFEDDTIMQFWGFKDDGNPVIMEFHEDNDKPNHRFTLASRSVEVNGVGETYDTDIFEMRAALGGQAAWETYLCSQNEVADSPHEGKCTRVGIISKVRDGVKGFIADAIPDMAALRAFDLRALAPLKGRVLGIAGGAMNKDSDHEENIKRLYDYVLAFAQEYYGRKYMVRIPFVFARLDEDTNEIVTSQEPAEGGFVPESDYAGAIGNGLMPTYTNFVSKPDGRLVCYCRYDDFAAEGEELDLSGLSEDDFVIDGDNVFILCEVDPQLVFLDRATAFSPRAIVTLPTPIYPKGEDGVDFQGIIRNLIEDRAIDVAAGPDDADAIDEIINVIFARMGAEQALFGWAGIAQVPDMIAVPLQSNILTYGPWYASGAAGGVQFEQNESLVPWNFGGYEAMNLTGEATVVDAFAQQQVSEAGTIEVPGAPNYSPGSELLAGGPYITGLSCQIGIGGVTSTYRMETWTPRFGKVYKQNAELMAKNARRQQANRRQMRELLKTPPVGSAVYKNRANAIINPPDRVKGGSTIGYIGGEILKNTDTSKGVSNVEFMPTYHLATQLGKEYAKKAFMSLDGLFVPFSTHPDVASTLSSGLPHYESPTASGSSGRSVTELNPFIENHNFAQLIGGTGLMDDESMSERTYDNTYRPLALRGPLVISGWGYDTNGKPVPNSNPTTPSSNFLSNYLERPDEWKTGPLDIKWHNTRKVWVTGGTAAIRKGRAAQIINYRSSGIIDMYQYIEASGRDIHIGKIYAFDWCLASGAYILNRSNLLIAKEDGSDRDYIISVCCEAEPT